MKKTNLFPWILASGTTLLFVAAWLWIICPALNIHNLGLWTLIAAALFVFIFVFRAAGGHRDFPLKKKPGKAKKAAEWEISLVTTGKSMAVYLLPAAVLAVMGLIVLFGSPVFNATDYAAIRSAKESDFAADLAESVGTDSIALMDTASAQMLGDREIGSLSDVVSQFDVAWDYTQIDFGGKPIKVAPLEYAGFFKWINNSQKGVGGYVTVDPVSMSASFRRCEGMKFIPSAYFTEDAARYLWMQYPTLMLENLHFEIDEEGKPYYVASVIEKTIGLFGGKTVSGCVVLDPVTGETVHYALAEIPRWVDVVFDGYLICEQYNWNGLYGHGFWNSLFTKKDCKQVTTYYVSDNAEEEEEDAAPVSDFGYIAKDGDIWIYTGITSVNGDSSNIGFLLANERTGESRYYVIAGADEKSAMAAAEGEVQEKRYQASFPSLINISGEPTYIMVLKDSGGLVKLYATVNVQQYNLVTTAPTQAECIQKYKALLGIDTPTQPEQEAATATVTIAAIHQLVVDGDTYFYLVDTKEAIYRAKAASHPKMLLLKAGDKVTLTLNGDEVTAWEMAKKK